MSLCTLNQYAQFNIRPFKCCTDMPECRCQLIDLFPRRITGGVITETEREAVKFYIPVLTEDFRNCKIHITENRYDIDEMQLLCHLPFFLMLFVETVC